MFSILDRMAQQTLSSKDIFAAEDQYGCRNYAPLPVALCRGEGLLFIILILLV